MYEKLLFWCSITTSQQDFDGLASVMVSLLTSSVADRGVKSGQAKIKDYKIGICCFSAKHAAKQSSTVAMETCSVY